MPTHVSRDRSLVGFVPVVPFRNEPDERAPFGVSELDSVEPILKAYQEVKLHAVQGTRLLSSPKVNFIVADPRPVPRRQRPELPSSRW